MYVIFLNDEKGDNVDYTDGLEESLAELTMGEWWKRVEPGYSLIIKRLT